jgi:hypothetical protein
MTASITQNLFSLIKDSHIDKEAVALLTQLVEAGLVKMDDPVVLERSQTTQPLTRALLGLAEPNSFSYNFYLPETAQQLLALDPNFFQTRGTESGELWLEHTLFLWTKPETDRSVPGSKRDGVYSFDEWAKVAFSGLTDKQKSSDSLWMSCLKLDLPGAAHMLVAHRPQGWEGVDEKGKPLIAACAGAWGWEEALKAGLDPYSLTSKGKPFWRAMLPVNSSTSAEKGSAREAVEAWVRQEIKKPDSAPELMEYVRKNALARINVNLGANAWSKLTHKGQVEFVSRLPSEWITWEHNDAPLWLKLVADKQINLSSWVDTISKHPSWLKHIAKDHLSQLAFDLFKAHPKLPDVLSPTLDVGKALSDPRKDDVMKMVGGLLKTNTNAMLVFMESLHLQAGTPSAPSSNRRGPRL